MSNRSERPSRYSRHASGDHRWLIGIAISVIFGLFGAVMAVLSYRARSPETSAPPVVTTTVAAPKPTVAPAASAAPTTPVGATMPVVTASHPTHDHKKKDHDK